MSKISVISISALLLLAGLFVAGCEVGSATETILISPSAVEVKQGQTVQFTASGGYEYTWSLHGSGSSSSSLGMLSSTRGQTVTYTSLSNPGGSNVVVETLTVTSTIPGDASSTNSASATQASGTATITHTGSD
jgi:plastocyanin